jgi:hypothetical protein
VRRDALRATVLALLVAGLWCIATGRTSREAWRVPVDYYGDSWYTLALLKAASDGHLAPLRPLEVPELGAPFRAGWNGFLRQHKLQYWLAGRAARAVGLFPAANLLLLLAAVLAALAFYAVGRYFRARPEWALAGAAAFALSPFLFYRSLSHLTLTFYWPVPLAILAVTWAFSRHGLRLFSRQFATAAAIVVVAGLHNVYYAGLLAQFLALAALAQALVRRRVGPALASLVLIAILLASVVADNVNLVYAAWHGGATEGMARPYGNLERFALKPIELLLPVSNAGLAPWAGLGATYFRGALYRGEMGAAYLGLAGVAALVVLVASAAVGCVRRPTGLVPPAFLAVIWILAYSVVGGLNGVLGTLGFIWFRATSRYSIWILALVLLWAVNRLSRLPIGRVPGAVLAAAAAAVALWDQMPPRPAPAVVERIVAATASDSMLVRSLESALPKGAMLFQLPVVDFPEGSRIGKATDYEHLRPYLFSSRLRFSYGADKGGGWEAWQREAEELEPEAMAEALERMGFSGLLLNRKAYEDGGEELRTRLAATGRPVSWQSPDHDFLFIRLTPAAIPALPEAVFPSPGTPIPPHAAH